MRNGFKPVITVFHCVKSLGDETDLSALEDNAEIRSIKIPCSSMVKDVFLLRAFEAGADAVVVLVCPEGECRYVDGNIRAKKRVQRVKNLLDEIGIGSERLGIFNMPSHDEAAVSHIIQKTASELMAREPAPAAYGVKL